MVRIKVIIPNAGMSPDTLKAREEMLSTVARKDTMISVDCIESGPESIESFYDIAVASSAILHKVKEAEENGFHAIILYCSSDPILEAAREIVDIPVIGPGEVSLHIACMLSHKFSIVSPTPLLGVEQRLQRAKIPLTCLASVRVLDIPVVALRDDNGITERARTAIVHAARKAVREDGAQAIVLGCLGMAGLDQAAREEIGVPVIDPAFVAINMAELLVQSRLTHSRAAFPAPPNKKFF